MNRERLSELLDRLSNLFNQRQHSAAAAAQLNSAQLGALLYLFRANHYSNTPAGVTEYLGLTKGTVSQTLLRLESNGWLRRRPDALDARVTHLELTPTAQRFVDRYRSEMVVTALPADQAALLESVLENLLLTLQRTNGGRSFGVCKTCRHFQQSSGWQYTCGLTQEPLALTQIKKICREHECPAPKPRVPTA